MEYNIFFFFPPIRIINGKENKRWNSCIISTPITEFMVLWGKEHPWCKTKDKTMSAGIKYMCSFPQCFHTHSNY